MKPFIPRRLEPVAFAVIVTCIMTCVVSGISTVLAVGVTHPGFGGLWFAAWMSSWAVAAPVMTFVAPAVRRLLRHIVAG
jgi:hypothetical protein